jgi:hypothetical protein
MRHRHGSTRGNAHHTGLVSRARGGAAVREAGGTAMHASLAGTQPQPSPTTAHASSSSTTPHQTQQEY